MKNGMHEWLLEKSWWCLPVTHMLLFWPGMAAICLPYDRTLLRAAFFLIWSGRGVVLLLPVLLSVQLLREKWKLALRTTLCSAVALTPTAIIHCWLAKLPCPPDIAKQPLHPVCYLFFWLGGAAAACLAVAGMLQLLRGRLKPIWLTILFAGAVLPPFLWLVWKMSGVYR